MSTPIEIKVGQTWQHMVFGVIKITEVKKDCNGAPWYLAQKKDGTITAVMPRNP